MPLDTPAVVASRLLASGVTDFALLDRMPIALAFYDAEGALIHANAHCERLVDCSAIPSALRSVTRWQGSTADGGDLPRHDFPCSRALRGEIVSPGVDLLHFGADGQGRWLNVSAAPIADPGRDVILGIVILYVDAHESVQAGAFAARAARRFRQFAENSGTAIWIADAATGEFTYRNPLHVGLLDAAAGEMAGIANWLDMVDQQDRPSLRRHYDDVRQGRTERFEYGVRAAPGRPWRRLRETSFPVRDDAGAIVMIGGMTDDVTPINPSNLYFVGQSGGAFGQAAGRCASRVKAFGCLSDLLDVAQFLTIGCVIVDLATTDDADNNLPRTLAEHAFSLPIVIIGRPETHVATAVAAMRAGAADYLIPPVDGDALAEAVARAAARCAVPAVAPAPAGGCRLDRLSKREREVLTGLKAGGTNKSIARDLGLSPRTVELHRSHLMERMNAASLAELLQLSQAVAV